MSRLSTVAVLAVAVLLVTSGAGVATATQTQEESSLFDQLTGVEVSSSDATLGERVDAVSTVAQKFIDRAMYEFGKLTADTSSMDRAQQYASNTSAVFETHAAALEPYVNQRVSAPVSDWDTIAVEFVVEDATATRYLLADESNGEFTNLRMVNDTTRDVDGTLTIEEFAAEDAASELDYFATEYVAENRDVDMALLSRMQAYSDSIDLPDGVRE
ncbi:hypothetical protein [Halosegnis longus]|uniref:hypothetical protein n=1 Tax=Halosegnis longus TaxID=2216012 RepID=UPI00129D4526|nr:hypothetical protein [Halosegnis longus]